MTAIFQTVVRDSVKVLVGALLLLYTGLVLTAYATEGLRYQPRFRWTEPARSGERLLVWTGVKLLDGFLRLTRSMFNQLFLASAEIGLWLTDRSGNEVRRKVRSRFL
ncbi:MAG TPA: hypothetical protein VMI06_18375 [Terriglobia bacterium]|nr:hypothetical protein [Terriglobia bacterium]